ncbi:hypothetical protein CDL15_Pgr021446, partial [Punica granatum]
MDTNIKGGEELNAVNFKITIGEEMEEMVHKQLYVIFMVNLTTNKKTWKSLHMHGNWDILKEVLCTDSVGEEGCNLCLMQGNEDVVAGSLLSYLNESQKETALSCLYKTQCQHRHIIELIWGPPGTGKTKTVSTMLFTLLNMKCKTLVCAPSNVAVKEVASRVQRLVRDSSLVSYGDILLFGRKDRLKISSLVSYGDILLFGSKDSYTEEIYLEYRVDRIRECLAPLTGWRNCIASMITLLEDSVQQYNIFVENESVGNSNNEEEKSHNVGQRKPFIEFIRERYSSTLGPLDRCISILCIHISRSYMSKDIFDNMMGLPGHLKSFGKLLFQKDSNLFSSRLEEAFSRKATDRLSTKTPRDPLLTLYLKRCECLSALAVVQDSLNRLKLPSFMTSNTYKLHFVDMEPPKLLVIDEAAQLKECESVVPLQLAGLSHAVLVGDERQLPSIVKSKVSDEASFGRKDDEGLAKTILEVKKEYDQLDDLLSGSSVLFRSARWKVIFSENFRQSFRKLISLQMKLSVINLLLKLSNGWRPKRRDMNMICENSLQIVKQFKVESLYVLCTVDIEKDFNYVQVLKVWDVLPLEDIPKMVKRLDGIYETYSNEYIDRCKEKSLDGLLEVPKSWQAPFNFRRSGNSSTENQEGHDLDSVLDSCSYAENSKVNDSLLLMKFYPLSSDIVNHLLSDKDGKEVELPFEVTNEEREIINFPRSTFILGRSGTGKTTILTMKLFKKEQLYQMALNRDGNGGFSDRTNNEERDEDPNTDGLHQLFVTVSPKLCFAVRRHISQLKSFACGRNILPESPSGDIDFIDSTDQFKDIPDSFFDIPPKSYPLVVTFQKFLMMLDGTIGVSYFERFPDLREICRGKVGPIRSLALQTYVRAKEVNYEKFCTTYWPHFNEALMRKFDPSRVFTEIISHIKGGIRVVDSSNGRISREDYVLLSEGRASTLTVDERERMYDIFLNGRISREDYVLLSEGRASTLTVDEREKMYDIFLDYEKMKARNGEFDLSDLVNDLHSRLQHEKWKGDRMEFVYIDEVQDLTMRQIALFKNISSNVEEGFVFSGDTAQTIARGIDFRFEDIRFLFYKEFSHGLGDEVQQNLHKGRISKVFHLSQNFRTHAAILKLAQSVINLLSHYFPLLIDILSPEVSRICGEAPIFLESGNEENAIISIFGNNLSVGVNVVGFGAEQVILVRDDCARHEVLNYVGKQALILTVVECKGLEFQDVLLYNFFGSSPMKNQWRVIYKYMKEQNLLDNSFPRGFPNFDLAKHNILCSELKQLYVAITRTRQRLWIVESNMEFSKPMFDYWKKLCLIQVRKLDNYLAEEMKVASTPEQWKSQGWKLMDENNYEMATMCFERAQFALGEKFARAAGLNAAADQMSISNPEEASHDRKLEDKISAIVEISRRQFALGEKFARAAGLNAAADQMSISNPEEASHFRRQAGEMYESIGKNERAAQCFLALKDYERAGTLFESIGMAEFAAECFYELKEYERAGSIYLEKCGESSLERAGECFLLAGCCSQAADVYSKGNFLSQCLSACAQGNLFELGLSYIQSWKEGAKTSKPDTVKIEQDFLETCAHHYYKQKNFKMMMRFVKVFPSMEAMRSFLRNLNCLEELLSMEEEFGNFLKAADVAKLKGDTLLEARLLGKGGHFKEASMCILWYVLYSSLWGTPGSRGWPLKKFEGKKDLLRRAKSYAILVSEHFYHYAQIESTVLLDEVISLPELGELLSGSSRNKNITGEILCSWKILDVHLKSDVSLFCCEDNLVPDFKD